MVSIRDLEILGYVHSGVNTCDLPLLWVWLWRVVGRPRIGQGKLPAKTERAITSPSPGFMGPALIAGSMGRSLSGHAKSHHHSLSLTLGGFPQATACSIVAEKHRGAWGRTSPSGSSTVSQQVSTFLKIFACLILC